MHGYLQRDLKQTLANALQDFPAVAILGPRQVGKSTLARELAANAAGAVYLDLENPADRSKLDNPVGYLEQHQDKLVCLDEIQRVPELFPVLRSLIDQHKRPGRFLILGSASRELLRQSSESLAGRLAWYELTPFHAAELQAASRLNLAHLGLRGGFADSYLARSDEASFEWRSQFVRSFLERDIPQLSGSRVPAESMRRLWTMLAHLHGQALNLSQLGGSLGVSHTTVRTWLDILQQTFVVRLLPAWSGNTGKRLIKSPKVYICDSGLLHCLLGIETREDLAGHPVYGASFEGMVIEQLLAIAPRWQPSYYRSSNGAEVDLILERGQRRIAIEIKASAAPTLSRGVYSALKDLKLQHAWTIAQVSEAYPAKAGDVLPLLDAISRLRDMS